MRFEQCSYRSLHNRDVSYTSSLLLCYGDGFLNQAVQLIAIAALVKFSPRYTTESISMAGASSSSSQLTEPSQAHSIDLSRSVVVVSG